MSKNIFQKIADMLKVEEKERIFETFCVSGAGTIELKLKHYPAELDIHFEPIDPVPCVPCNVGNDDTLCWEIIHHPRDHHHRHNYELLISWNVSTVRTIVVDIW